MHACWLVWVKDFWKISKHPPSWYDVFLSNGFYEVTLKHLSATGFKEIVKVFDCINSELLIEYQIKRMGVTKKLTHPSVGFLA